MACKACEELRKIADAADAEMRRRGLELTKLERRLARLSRQKKK